MADALPRSRALWNRQGLDLESDEVRAQILSRARSPRGATSTGWRKPTRVSEPAFAALS